MNIEELMPASMDTMEEAWRRAVMSAVNEVAPEKQKVVKAGDLRCLDKETIR